MWIMIIYFRLGCVFEWVKENYIFELYDVLLVVLERE